MTHLVIAFDMQRLGSPWLSHVLPLNIPSTNLQIRSAHVYRRRKLWPDPKTFRTKPIPLFSISPLLLDLDAEESPYVRNCDENVDGEVSPFELRNYSRDFALTYRAIMFQKSDQRCENKFRGIKTKRFHIWRISDYDVLSFLLDPLLAKETDAPFGDPRTRELQDTMGEELSIIIMNGIPEHVQNKPSKFIRYVLRRQHVTRRYLPGVGGEEELNRVLSQRKVLQDFGGNMLMVERIIGDLLQTPEGSKLVSNCTATLGELFTDLALVLPPERLLPFLNNLIINLNSRGLPTSQNLIECAYQASWGCHAFTVTQKYLKMYRESGHGSPQFANVLDAFKQVMVIPDNPEEDRTHHLLAIYGLLTGRLLGEDLSQPSFRDGIYKCTRMQFTEYVTFLARLGAFRTMWYIWHMHPGDAVTGHTFNREAETLISPPLVSLDADNMLGVKRFSKAKAFASAIGYTVNVNGRFAELVNAPNFGRTVGKGDEDCELDIQTIMTSTDLLLANQLDQEQQELLNDLFKGERLEADVEKVEEIFEGSIQEAMPALQSYLNHVLSIRIPK
ncbi:hypothetical protein F4781DRAFT_394943 [Annulohypoxylon bovei var. microspora]|nr:hypothetical protein F4781DRAFT_394943 [Annulohypoxylon bovei var. microspora]